MASFFPFHYIGLVMLFYRDFLMCCEDREDQKSWINEIKGVISRPLDAKDSAGRIHAQLCFTVVAVSSMLCLDRLDVRDRKANSIFMFLVLDSRPNKKKKRRRILLIF